MKKRIEVVTMAEAEDFINLLNDKTRNLVFKAFEKTELGLKGDWFKKLHGTDDIFEFRVDADGKFNRLFAFWDGEGEDATLIVCTHGLEKKTNKTPRNEIKKAEQLKNRYFSQKT